MNRVFDVICPKCHRVLENVKIGTNSYLEFHCTHCNNDSFAKSTATGVRTELLKNLKNK